jgi:hypothetical protein
VRSIGRPGRDSARRRCRAADRRRR